MASESVPRAFVTMAKDLSEAGQFGEAIKILQEGLKQYPNFTSARVLLGEVYWLSGSPALAQTELEQVVKSVPDNFAAHRKLTVIYRELGERDAAVQSCRVVLEANPKDQDMRALLEELEKSQTEAAPAGVSPSASPLQPAEPIQPAEPAEEGDHLDSETLAELYVAQGHRDKGLAVYQRLMAKSPAPRWQAKIEALLKESLAPAGTAAGPSARPTTSGETAAPARRTLQVSRLEGLLAAIQQRRRS